MPYKITKTDGKYRVTGPGGVHAKGTTKKKALAQIRPLNAIEHSDWRPTGKKHRLPVKKGSPTRYADVGTGMYSSEGKRLEAMIRSVDKECRRHLKIK